MVGGNLQNYTVFESCVFSPLFLIRCRYNYIKEMFVFHILDGRLYLKTTVMY